MNTNFDNYSNHYFAEKILCATYPINELMVWSILDYFEEMGKNGKEGWYKILPGLVQTNLTFKQTRKAFWIYAPGTKDNN